MDLCFFGVWLRFVSQTVHRIGFRWSMLWSDGEFGPEWVQENVEYVFDLYSFVCDQRSAVYQMIVVCLVAWLVGDCGLGIGVCWGLM